jgi:hypothetical protein
MTIWNSNSYQKDANGSELGMTEPKEWPYRAAQVRDETAELVMDASRDLMSFIRKNNAQDPKLMSALLNLQQAQTFLVSVGAQIRPERL